MEATNQFVPMPFSVFGMDKEGAVPGMQVAAEHPHLHPVIPYVFKDEHFRVVQYAWVREVTRAENKPRRGVWISGPKGSGKTTMIEQFFARLNVPVASVTANREFRVLDAIQSKTLRPVEGGGMEIVRQDGPLAAAMRGGYPVIINELDLADPGELTGLNDVVDRGFFVVPDTGEVIRAKRGFFVCVTANSNGSGDLDGEYAGVGTMNTALMSRFYKFGFSYPTEDEEMEILEASGVIVERNREVARIICKVASLIRSGYESRTSGLTSPISTREVIDAVEAVIPFSHLSAKGVKVTEYVLRLTYGNGLPPHAAKAVDEILDRVVAG